MTSSAIPILNGPRSPAASGLTKQLVIFLHGYGADGSDLIGLSREFSRALPDAAFVSPNAPQPLPQSPFGGRQWFSLAVYSEESLWRGVNEAAPALERFIFDEAARANLPLSSVALIGFSQGTMMALHVGYRLPEPLAGIVGFSGHLAGGAYFEAEMKVKPPALLIHGSADEVVPVQALHAARMVLGAAGVPLQWQVRPGLGHGIDPEGLTAAAIFLRAAFGLG